MVGMPRSANCAESFVIEMVMPNPGLPRVIAISGEPAPRDGTAGLPLDCRVEERLHCDAPAGHRASSCRVAANVVGMGVSAGAVTSVCRQARISTSVSAGVGKRVSAHVRSWQPRVGRRGDKACWRGCRQDCLQACVCKRVSANAWRGVDACRRGESVDARAAAAAHSNISFARSARKLKQTKTSPSAIPPPGHTPTQGGLGGSGWTPDREGGEPPRQPRPWAR